MNKLSGFLELLKASLKILSQNGKLMAITAALYFILSSISFFLYTSFSNPFILDFILKLFSLASMQPGTPEYTKLLVAIRLDIGIFLGIITAYAVLSFFIALFAQTTIIIIASCYYSGDNLSVKELVLKVSRTWTRPFVTSFYVILLAKGYISVFALPFLVPSLVLYDHPTVLITLLVFLATLVILFYLYLYVVWSLAAVVSVVEDSYGISALGKAREVVKGKRIDGFLLNLLFMLVMVLIVYVVGFKLLPAIPRVAAVIQLVCICAASMLVTVAYTALYFQSKNTKTSGSLEYSQIPTTPVLDEDLP